MNFRVFEIKKVIPEISLIMNFGIFTLKWLEFEKDKFSEFTLILVHLVL